MNEARKLARPFDPRQRPTSVRWVVLMLIAFASGSAYLTRHCIAVANTTIEKELELTPEQMGWVLGFFAIGYFICQVPGGWVGTRFGTRTALPLFSLLWSILTIASSLATSFMFLSATRIVYGMAQAGLVPNSAKIVADWLPLSRRGLSSAIITASMSLGGVIAMGLTAQLLKVLDWRDIFRLYSLVGITWSIGFYLYFRNSPSEHFGVNEAELRCIRGDDSVASLVQQSQADPASVPEASLSEAGIEVPPDWDAKNPYAPSGQADLKNEQTPANGEKPFLTAFEDPVLLRSLLAISVQAMFRAAGFGLFVTWFPALLEKGYSVSRETAGMYSMLPLLLIIPATLVGGLFVDYLLRKTGNKWISRSGLSAASLGLCCLFTLASAATSNATLFVILMSLGAWWSGFANPAGWAATMDLAGRYTAVVVGLMNMAGTIGGFAMPIVVGYLIGDIQRSGGDYNQVIYLTAAIYLAAAITWLAVDPSRSLTTNETAKPN